MNNSDEFISTDIGDFPKSWEIKKIKTLGEIITGTTPSTKNQEYYNGNIPFIAPGDMSNIKYIKKTQKTLSEKGLSVSRSLPKDSVLVVCIGATIGKTGMTFEEISVTNQQINSIIPKSNTDPHYLYYVLTFRSKDLPSLASRAAIPIVNKSNFSEFKIPIPSLEEQKKISLVLSSIQKTIQKVSNVIKSVSELKKTLLHHLFTYGPVPINQRDAVKHQETAIGLLPKEWEVKKIKEVAYVNKISRNPKKETSDINFTYIDISSIEGGTGRFLETKSIIGKKAPSRARRVVQTKDVIVSTVRPYLQAFAFIPEIYNNEICSTGFAVLTAKKIIIPKFLYYVCFTNIVSKQFNQNMRGANYPAINAPHVENTLIPLPSLNEQKEIAGILTSIDEKISAEINKKTALEELFKTLLEKLMTGQIRVNDLNLEEIQT